MTLATRPRKKKKERKLSRLVKPADMSVEAWQIALREDYAKEQRFKIENLGDDPVFSEFGVTNPVSRRTYQVTVRGLAPGTNTCTCPDFAVNTLGTCKHIAFLLRRLAQRKGGRKLLRQGFTPAHSQIDLCYGARRTVTYTLGSDAPADLKRQLGRYFDSDGRLLEGAATALPTLLALAERKGWDLRCSDVALDFLAQLRDADYRRHHLRQVYGGQAPPEVLKTTLYPYQWEGALFAATAGRALLGDEMGLGKTVQALAYVELMVREFNAHQVLIICPSSLKYQWKAEIEKFTDRTVCVIEGITHQRRERYQDEAFFKIVNYDVVHRDLDAIGHMAPDIVILDEAQRIKNWRTRAARAVKSVTSPYALVLTGTPLENRLEELHSIVSFVDQYRLGPLFRLLDQHQVTEPESTQVTGYRNLSSIAETLQPIMLRRRKKDVQLQLPDRIDRTYFVPMEPQQVVIHRENQEMVAKLVAKWRRYNFLTEADQHRLQVALLRMRMVCDNTFLVDHKTVHGKKVDELMQVLDEVLEDPEAKVVVFSEWTRMHDLVKAELESRSIGYVYLHGGVPSTSRGDLVGQFRTDPQVRVFLSTEAGNAGLNLQSASVVVNLDLPWNPARLEQRIARAHRIGQQRTVQVINFVAQGSIEHGMLSVLQFKKNLFEGILDGGEDNVTFEGSRLQSFMQTVEAASAATPETAQADTVDEVAPDASVPPTEDAHPAPVASESDTIQNATPMHAPHPTPDPGHADNARSFTPLLTAGLSFVQELGNLIKAQQSGTPDAHHPLVEQDAATGRSYLRLPVPEPEVMEQLLTTVGSLLSMLAPK